MSKGTKFLYGEISHVSIPTKLRTRPTAAVKTPKSVQHTLGPRNASHQLVSVDDGSCFIAYARTRGNGKWLPVPSWSLRHLSSSPAVNIHHGHLVQPNFFNPHFNMMLLQQVIQFCGLQTCFMPGMVGWHLIEVKIVFE